MRLKVAINYIKKFIQLESSSGIILFAVAILAILVDNSPLSPIYEHFLELPLTIQLGNTMLSNHLLHWINDGLMVIFFLLVGLEIKRELVQGELNSLSKAILPVAAAMGGMAAPALVFSIINQGNDFAMRGWAIPTATDIAFSLGILSLLGSRVPSSLKIFLMALAIFDDLGAIIVIALFYNNTISVTALGVAAVFLLVLIGFNRLGVKSLAPYMLVGIGLWLAFLHSGVHATLAGVILALTIPLEDKNNPEHSPAKELIHKIHPWVAYMILPVFAFANAGVSFDDVPAGISNIISPPMLGIALGLILGKTIGVFTVTFVAVKSKLVKMPTNSTWPQILGIAMVCGVGFTMSLFVGSLAYPTGSTLEPYNAWVRLGVLSGSLISGALGYMVLSLTTPKNK